MGRARYILDMLLVGHLPEFEDQAVDQALSGLNEETVEQRLQASRKDLDERVARHMQGFDSIYSRSSLICAMLGVVFGFFYSSIPAKGAGRPWGEMALTLVGLAFLLKLYTLKSPFRVWRRKRRDARLKALRVTERTQFDDSGKRATHILNQTDVIGRYADVSLLLTGGGVVCALVAHWLAH